ncbi:MAG: GNAT family N-acetyltransferase [Candidatus Heimdallarchaeota archaeon]
MIIRKATQKDIQAIIDIWIKSGLPTRPKGRDKPENLANQLKQPNLWMLVAEEDSEIIGVVLVTHDARKGWINRLAVLPSRLHEGIATSLLREAEQSLKEIGLLIISTLISDDNQISRQLFEKENYRYHETITYYAKRLIPDA